MSYASAGAARGLAEGLGNIGRLLVERRESERERQLREAQMASLDEYRRAQLAQDQAELLQRRGEVGLRQRERKETTAEQRLRDVRQDWASRGVNVSDVDINAAYGPGTGKMLASTPQGLAAAGERRGAMTGLARAAGVSARGGSATTPGGSVAIPNISAVVAGMPPRRGGDGEPVLTPKQAMEMLNERYAEYEGPNNTFSGYSVPFEQRYAEAQRMARGGAPAPTPTPAPTLFDVARTPPPGFPGGQALTPAAPGPAPAARLTPAPAPAVTAAPRPAAPAVAPQPAAKIPVSREEYAAIIAEQGETYASRHYTVTR